MLKDRCSQILPPLTSDILPNAERGDQSRSNECCLDVHGTEEMYICVVFRAMVQEKGPRVLSLGLRYRRKAYRCCV